MANDKETVDLYIPTSVGDAYMEMDRQRCQAVYDLMMIRGRMAFIESERDHAQHTAGWLCFISAVLFCYAVWVTVYVVVK